MDYIVVPKHSGHNYALRKRNWLLVLCATHFAFWYSPVPQKKAQKIQLGSGNREVECVSKYSCLNARNDEEEENMCAHIRCELPYQERSSSIAVGLSTMIYLGRPLLSAFWSWRNSTLFWIGFQADQKYQGIALFFVNRNSLYLIT